jgi:hypothetical protein
MSRKLAASGHRGERGHGPSCPCGVDQFDGHSDRWTPAVEVLMVCAFDEGDDIREHIRVDDEHRPAVDDVGADHGVSPDHRARSARRGELVHTASAIPL